VQFGLLAHGRLCAPVERSRVAPAIGRALCAQRNVPAGNALAAYGGARLSAEQLSALRAQHSNASCARLAYIMSLGDDEFVDGHPEHRVARGCAGNVVNDPRGIGGAAANAAFEVAETEAGVAVLLVALRDVRTGDEIWADYGADYWRRDSTAAPCSCGRV